MTSQTSYVSSPAATVSATIVNPNDPQNPILSLNMSTVTWLTASKYITWSLQIPLFLDDHSLKQLITDDGAIPPPTVQTNDLTIPNPAYAAWQKQRQNDICSNIWIYLCLTSTSCFHSNNNTWGVEHSAIYIWPPISGSYEANQKNNWKRVAKDNLRLMNTWNWWRRKWINWLCLESLLIMKISFEYILDGLDDDCRGVA